jgi:hypothetical protein
MVIVTDFPHQQFFPKDATISRLMSVENSGADAAKVQARLGETWWLKR